jgi:hypothetical protein
MLDTRSIIKMPFTTRWWIPPLMLTGTILFGAGCLLNPLAALAGFACIVAFVAAFFSPKTALWISAALLPVYNVGFQLTFVIFGEKESVNIHFYYVAVLVAFSAWALRRLVREEPGGRAQSISILSVYFLAWVLISWTWSINPSGAVSIIVELISGLLIYLLLADPQCLRDSRELIRFFAFLLVVGVILATMTVISFWYAKSKSFNITKDLTFFMALLNEKGRAAGFTGVNYSATMLNYFIFIGLSLLFIVKGYAKLLVGGAIFFLIAAVVMTGSKAGFGGLLAGLMVLIGLTPFFKGKRIITAAGLFGMLIAAFLCATLVMTGDVTTSRVAAVGASFSYDTRLEWWQKGFEALFYTSYGMGAGVGGFRKMIDPVLYAHNIFLSVLFDLGVVGMILFLGLLMVLFFHIGKTLSDFREQKDIQVVLSCMIAAMVGFLMNNLLQGDYYMRLFWLMLGIDAGIVNMLYAASRREAETVKQRFAAGGVPATGARGA